MDVDLRTTEVLDVEDEISAETSSSSGDESMEEDHKFCGRCGSEDVVKDGFCQSCLDDQEQEEQEIKDEVYFSRHYGDEDAGEESTDDEDEDKSTGK